MAYPDTLFKFQHSPLYQNGLLDEGDEDGFEPVLCLDGLEPIRLSLDGESCKVVACDTSTIKIAESSVGSVWAIRGAVIERVGRSIKLNIYGPLIYLVSQNTVPRLIKMLKLALGLKDGSIPSMDVAHRVIAGLFEKLLQHMIAQRLDGGILLIDGSLTAGPLDSPLMAVKHVIDRAKSHGRGVIAFAKSSKLRLLGHKITSLLNNYEPPYMIRFRGGFKIKPNHHILGDVYVAHLSKAFFPFRTDIAARDSSEPFRIMEDLLASDSLIYGYPETLILAHQYATFNKIDILGIQSNLEILTNSKIVDYPDVRESIFSPLDRG